MVKRANVLDALEAEAEVPYEQTRLARDAQRARPRVAILTGLGAFALAVETYFSGSGWWLVPAALLAGAAVGVWRGRLAGLMGAGFGCALGLLLPVPMLWLNGFPFAGFPLAAASLVWGIALGAGVLTLIRDAELQNAYGRWARRVD